jgi:hypothetical protein
MKHEYNVEFDVLDTMPQNLLQSLIVFSLIFVSVYHFCSILAFLNLLISIVVAAPLFLLIFRT